VREVIQAGLDEVEQEEEAAAAAAAAAAAEVAEVGCRRYILYTSVCMCVCEPRADTPAYVL